MRPKWPSFPVVSLKYYHAAFTPYLIPQFPLNISSNQVQILTRLCFECSCCNSVHGIAENRSSSKKLSIIVGWIVFERECTSTAITQLSTSPRVQDSLLESGDQFLVVDHVELTKKIHLYLNLDDSITLKNHIWI